MGELLMSYDVPSGPPPSGPPPSGPPPSGPPAGPPPGGSAETLDSHGGDRPPRGRSRRGTVLAGVGVLGVVALGGAGWAAYSFFSTGPQPAEALPASTLAYASVDLDPSGGQKIEALRTLRKFPAFRDAVGLDTDDDVREWIFEQVQGDECPGLDYADDVEPWLGDRFALAAVDAGGDTPAPVFVIQVSDADRADAGLDKIRDCAGGGPDEGAWTVDGDWLLLAEDQETVDEVAEQASDGTLADDEDFRHWTDEAGDSGIVSLYAAPGVGQVLADELDGLDAELGELDPSAEELVPSETVELLEDFEGAAATLRFDDGGLELEVAADAGASGQLAGGDAAGDVVASLPADTAAALAFSLGDDWVGDLLDQLSVASGQSTDELLAEAGAELGLDLPDDAETLLGDAVALAVDGDADPQALLRGPGDTGSFDSVGIGVKILGDPDGIDGVLDKLRTSAAGADAGLIDSDRGDDAVAVGPDADYRERLLSDRGLGDSDSFKRVVEHHDTASAVLYVDFDAGDDWLAELAGDEAEVRDNLEPLAALGLSAWLDGDTTHAVLKVTSD